MIRLIPGSYEELIQSEEIQMQENLAVKAPDNSLFYFSILPEKKETVNLRSVLPNVKWNGIENEFHNKLLSYCSFRFGNSLIDGVDVRTKVAKALPWSLILLLPAILIVISLSIWIAFRRVRFPDSKILSAIDSSLVWIHSIPSFWLATMFLLLFANPDMIHWFPSGLQSVSSENPYLIWIQYPHYLILPLLCLVLPALAFLIRLIKNGLENTQRKLFWKRALSSGLSIDKALFKEALPLAMIPVIAWFAGIFPALISGSLIIEQIFSIPGLGRLMYLSVSLRDWPVVQFLFFLGSALTIFGFIVSDFLLRYVDPRLNEDL
jgi:peptide/nickel transport system permease protein